MSNEKLRKLESRVEELEFRLKIPKLMTPPQLCEFLSISERQFYAWKRAGDAPRASYFSERSVRYDLEDVMAWVNSKQVG